MLPVIGKAQTSSITVEQAVQIAMENNSGLKASAQRIDQSKLLVKSGVDIGKTEFYYNYDQNNVAANDIPLHVWGVNQSIQFPSVYSAQKKVLEENIQLAQGQFYIDERVLTQSVYKTYYEIVYWQQMLKEYTYLDSLYTSFLDASNKRYEQGETNYLEKLNAKAKQKEVSVHMNQIKANVEKAYIVLGQYLQTDSSYSVSEDNLDQLSLTPLDTISHPSLAYFDKKMALANQMQVLEKRKLLPDFNFSLFQGLNGGMGDKSYMGFQVGIEVPLWSGAQKSKVAAAKSTGTIIKSEIDNYETQLISNYKALLTDLNQLEENINYYNTTGKVTAQEILFHAKIAYQNGEIDYFQYTQLLENAKTIEVNYLSALFQYNNTVIEANYLMN
ncbi:MAG: TolC family protein [Chitinophagales bacterium]